MKIMLENFFGVLIAFKCYQRNRQKAEAEKAEAESFLENFFLDYPI